MIDRKKVIKAVECRRNVHKRCGNPCEQIGNCEYAAWVRDSDGEPYYPCCCDTEKLCDDILLLLKEQEEQEEQAMPVDTKVIGGDCGDIEVYCCRACRFQLDPVFHFCPNCGQAVKWNG